jgi:Tfp pilus assembly protein PilN
MGQTDTEAIVQIEQTRRRLDSELEELATYLPPTAARAKRGAAILAGVSVGVLLLGFVLRKQRQRASTRRLGEIEDRLARMEQRLRR